MSQFVPLTAKEREDAYRDLVSMGRPIQIQLEKNKLLQGKAIAREKGQVQFKLQNTLRFEDDYEGIITFSLPPEIFFLKSKVKGLDGKYTFQESKEIFRLQRRDSFRLGIPDSVEAEVRFDGKTYRLHDLSQGGLSIAIPSTQSEDFISGRRLEGHLKVAGHEFPKIICEAKHARVQPLHKTKLLVGFQFLKLTAREEEHLFRLITDIARKHFRG